MIMKTITNYPATRLFSLDVLRGLDMLLLTVVGPLVMAAQQSWHCFPLGIMAQFRHGWGGFTLWDIIMPLFIFMCGAAIPFALERRLRQGKCVFWRHVLARVVLLWFLGGLVQGNWATLDPLKMSPYCNTLQTIAVGYLTVATVMLSGSKVMTIAVPVVLALGYTLLLSFGGDYSEFGNMAYKVDHAILKSVLPEGNLRVVKPSSYTWFLTSMMFAVMAFAGYHAAQILRSSRNQWHKVMMLLAYAAVLLLVGFVSEIWIPCIKHIFTLSFTAQAMGWCVLALCVLFVMTDIWKFRQGAIVFLFFGQMALVAYFTSNFFKPVLDSFSHCVIDGVVGWLPDSAGPFVICLSSIIGMVLVMFSWRKCRRKSENVDSVGVARGN